MGSTPAVSQDTTKHFVLVHGLCKGAWCWYKLISHLKSTTSHRITAVDLGGCGIHPSRLEDVASISDYVKPLMEVLESLSGGDDRVVVVGHSYGGLAVSLAMEKFPEKISVGVFITSYMPSCNAPPASQITEFFKRQQVETLMDCEFMFGKGYENPPTSALIGPDYMTTKMYRRCQPEDLELAKILVRPNGFFLEDLAQESLLTKEKYGSISRVYVVCEGDEVMEEEFQRFIIEDSPPNEVKSISGAGHMVMLSKPKELCVYLQEIANKCC